MLDLPTVTRRRLAASGNPEPIAGEDAIFLNLERPDTPTHTLKVVILDTARRGEPVTLADLQRVLPAYLGLTPRSTQRIGTIPGSRALAWVADDRFDLVHHLDERTAPAPGDRAALDLVCAGLAVHQLDRSRPLWSMTLVHGLAGGRQAVVVRVHHAIADGLAAINLLKAATSDSPDGQIFAESLAEGLASGAARTSAGGLPALVRAARASRRRTRAFGSRSEIPGGLEPRTVLNTRSGADRLCVSGELDLADLKRLAKSAGVTLNGALHAVIASALRDELLERGQTSVRPLVATFGVAEDTGPERLHGNAIATARAYLRADLADPIARLHETARSCLLSVGLRRARGFALHREGTHFAQRLAPLARAAFADLTPGVTNHITTANVPGPARPRWFGDVEVVDWISFSLAIAPADVNLTAYSYAGRMTIGLVVTPESMPDPRRFLARVEQALTELLNLVEPVERPALHA